MTVAQLSVEAVARRLCLAEGNADPDQQVYSRVREISTPEGTVYAVLHDSVPLWSNYEDMAHAVLADIAAGRLG